MPNVHKKMLKIEKVWKSNILGSFTNVQRVFYDIEKTKVRVKGWIFKPLAVELIFHFDQA